MSAVLGLDVGLSRTGVAVADDESLVPVSLETIAHSSFQELFERLKPIIKQHSVRQVVLGLPLLPSGEEGQQCVLVRDFAGLLDACGLPIEFIDERYSSTTQRGVDKDASAACKLLLTYLEKS